MAKILIIGGGVAGLSAGIYARLHGHEAIIFEKHSQAGGNLTGWSRGEYHIDNCIHWLTGTNKNTENYKIWHELGALGEVPVYQAEGLYTYEQNGKTFSLWRDLDRLQEEMITLSPQDRKEIEKLINAIKAVQGLMGTAGKGHDEKSNLFQNLWKVPALMRYVNLSIGDLAEKFKHPLLRNFIVCFIGKYFSSIALIVVYATFCGEDGGIPSGGSLQMANRIKERFESLGGVVMTDKTASRIVTDKGRLNFIEFADGSRFTGDYVVCATDIKTTYEKLLQLPMPKKLKKQYQDEKAFRFSSYHTAFSCKTDNLPFKGDYIFLLSKKDQIVLGTKYLILREFSHEKSFAPKGETVLQTLTFCKENMAKEFIRLKEYKLAYKQKKMELSERIEDIIIRKWPHLKGKIRCIDVWTPATYQRYYGEEIGAYMGFILPKRRLPTRLSPKVKGLRNVYLASQWLQSPGGLPTAANMGKRVMEYIERKERHVVFPWKVVSPKVKQKI